MMISQTGIKKKSNSREEKKSYIKTVLKITKHSRKHTQMKIMGLSWLIGHQKKIYNAPR